MTVHIYDSYQKLILRSIVNACIDYQDEVKNLMYHFIELVLVAKSAILSPDISNKSVFHKYSDWYHLVRKNILYQKLTLKLIVLKSMEYYSFWRNKLVQT